MAVDEPKAGGGEVETSGIWGVHRHRVPHAEIVRALWKFLRSRIPPSSRAAQAGPRA